MLVQHKVAPRPKRTAAKSAAAKESTKTPLPAATPVPARVDKRIRGKAMPAAETEPSPNPTLPKQGRTEETAPVDKSQQLRELLEETVRYNYMYAPQRRALYVARDNTLS